MFNVKTVCNLVSTRAASFSQLVLKHKSRFVRFGLVGASGVLVNTTLLYALTDLGGLHPVVAAVLATEVAILSNFFLNDRWTFRDVVSPGSSWIQRAFRYNCGAFGGLVISISVLAVLTDLGLYYLVANLFAVGAGIFWNYTVSYFYTWATPTLGRGAVASKLFATIIGRRRSITLAVITLLLAGVPAMLLYLQDWQTLERLGLGLLAFGVFILFAQSLFSLYLMLYTWEEPEKLKASSGPSSFLPPNLSFSVLLPARHEETVIFETIKRVWAADYPSELLEIVVVCHADDEGTISEAQRAIREIGSGHVRVETFSTKPINKPHGLNVGLQRTDNQVVTIFDAEDDIDPNIFNVVNTVMLEEGAGIVQAGVQLMNFRDHWFSVHNVLEYFFYFKSRLHYHANVGMIPLGGNTVFIRRDLIERVGGWDENCLTEDADIGLRLSTLGESIRVVYDAQHVTREETPDSVTSFIRQRTRWSQGFLQVLRKGTWLSLKPGQKLLAGYTFSLPLLQAVLTLLWPPALVALLWLRVPVIIAMISFLPLYALLLQLLVNAIGLCMFVKEYRLRFSPLTLASMPLTFLPYQWLLGISAVRALYREARKQNDWEKTSHLGAHRQTEITFVPNYELLLENILNSVTTDVHRASLMLQDPLEQIFSIKASRGLPSEVVASTKLRIGEGVVGWVAQNDYPIILNGKGIPDELHSRLQQPDLLSSIVLPLKGSNGMNAVVSLSSRTSNLSYEDLRRIGDCLQATNGRTALSESSPSSQGATMGLLLSLSEAPK